MTKDKSKVKSLFEHIKLHITDRTEIDKNSTEFQSNKKNWNYTINAYLNAIKSFDSYDSGNLSIPERLAEIYSFYNYPDIFEKTFIFKNNELQIKMFDDLTFLLVDSKRFGVTCGSKTSTCPLMWGHYAKNHTGLCLEFEIEEADSTTTLPMDETNTFEIEEVNYDDIPIDLFNYGPINESELKRQLLSTKSRKWNYEEEIRLISKQGPNKFNRKKIKSVIFGAKSNPKDRYTICKLLASLGYQFEFKIARIRPDQYELKIDPMNLGDIAGSGVSIEELGLSEEYNQIMNKK
ncbi:DUF2971 domain-containing protein [Zunongwangia pacifica]|uniref:DUF2971 domain-containing protein n=1 Tax=Zunongwangia pacifica TaxID=2911062 RepID=A0A9X1ZXM0_9FLAO|nr:DUF2971 domain-containing protein [Zunongwangia pacifica]MCL6220423.1 DUF2971 domain-containing protein [Zunongwangia pacifica]